MGLDHLGPSSAILLQFTSRLAQEPLMQGTETPSPPSPQMKQAAVAKQTTPDCTGQCYHKRRKKPASQLGGRNSKGTRATLCSSASPYGAITVVKIEQPPSPPSMNTVPQLGTQHQPQTPADTSAHSPQGSSSL